MMGFLQTSGRTCERRCRLFACACVRRIWASLRDVACRRAVELAERHADDRADVDELVSTLAGVSGSSHLIPAWSARRACWYTVLDSTAFSCLEPLLAGHWAYDWLGSAVVAEYARQAAVRRAAGRPQRGRKSSQQARRTATEAENQAQAALLRDIVGNPFHPAAVQAAWLTPTVVALAQAAYEERELPSGHLGVARLAVLADALEEAGCSRSSVLAHLRGPGPHVRGCFAVDAVLRKV
jgi:hypothetical protein